jgi:hypothetical protein
MANNNTSYDVNKLLYLFTLLTIKEQCEFLLKANPKMY